MFFGTNAYMATVLASRGEEHLLAPGLLLFNSAQVVASLLAFRYASRWLGRTAPMLAVTSGAAVCLVLFLLLPGAPALAAAVMVSFTTGIMLILLVSLPPAIAFRERAGALAAGVYTIGYALSFIVPLLGGALVDATGVRLAALAPPLLLGMFAVPLSLGLERATAPEKEAGLPAER